MLIIPLSFVSVSELSNACFDFLCAFGFSERRISTSWICASSSCLLNLLYYIYLYLYDFVIIVVGIIVY